MFVCNFTFSLMYNATSLNRSSSQQTQLRLTSIFFRKLADVAAFDEKLRKPSNAFDILPAQILSPSSMAPVRCVRQCVKTLFVRHLHQTLSLFKPCCSLFTPIPLERGTHMAQVRWRNETIPFGIRKTGLKPLAGVLRKASPCEAPLTVAMPCYFPFTSLDYNSHQPIQETNATFKRG